MNLYSYLVRLETTLRSRQDIEVNELEITPILLVPKPRFGNALAGKAPALSR